MLSQQIEGLIVINFNKRNTGLNSLSAWKNILQYVHGHSIVYWICLYIEKTNSFDGIFCKCLCVIYLTLAPFSKPIVYVLPLPVWPLARNVQSYPSNAFSTNGSTKISYSFLWSGMLMTWSNVYGLRWLPKISTCIKTNFNITGIQNLFDIMMAVTEIPSSTLAMTDNVMYTYFVIEFFNNGSIIFIVIRNAPPNRRSNMFVFLHHRVHHLN